MVVKVTLKEMQKFGFRTTAKEVSDLNEVMGKYAINHTYHRVWHFLAQCAEESGYGLYRTELGGKGYFASYVGRMGNRNLNEAYKYRGAGFIQLTGRNNYTAFSKAFKNPKILSLGADYVGKYYPWESAAYYWNSVNLNAKADAHYTVRQITPYINGGENGLQERINAYNKIKSIIK